MKQEPSEQYKVQYLAPAEVMKINTKVNGKEIKALLDSGATMSLIKRNFVKNMKFKNVGNKSKYVSSLGNSKIEIEGIIDLPIQIYGVDMIVECFIVADEDIGNDMILGIDFLKKNKFSINMKQRRISLTSNDKSKLTIHLNESNEITKVWKENIPVYAMKNVKLKPNEMSKIPVTFDCYNVNFVNVSNSSDVLFFEGANLKCETLDGVMNEKSEDMCVLSTSLNDKDYKVKAGEILGYIGNIVTIEENLPENTAWNEEKLAKEIKIGKELNDVQSKRVLDMLFKVKDVLSEGDNDIGTAKVVPHKIVMTQNTPIWQKPRNFAQPINEEIEEQCQDLLSNDILEYSNSLWSSPVVPVRKADGDLRLCVDYRQVNKITRTENFPMPNLTKSIYKANNVQYFSKIDLVRGYYQVPIDQQSRDITAFSTMQNHYQFKRLSFGLKNSGMAFQKVMQQILAPVMCSNIIIYIDDILIMSENYEHHLKLVEKVMRMLIKNGIKIKVKKCEFFQKEVNFLGHIVSNKGLRKSPQFIDKVLKIEKPNTVKEMRQFLGLINFQRKFVPNCSVLTKPLSECTVGAKSKKIKWSPSMEEAFNRVKQEVAKDVSLTYPDYSPTANKMELYVDASSTGAGACLMQKKSAGYEVIAYASMSFSDAQKRYSTTDRELAAIRWGIQVFKCFIWGVSFIVVTDHKPLIYLNNMANTNSRLMRTLEELAEHDFEVKYRPGVDNTAADFLSRINSNENDQSTDNVDTKMLPKSVKRVCTVEGGGDSMFESLIIALREAKENDDYSGELPENAKELRIILVEELMKNMKEYNLPDNKTMRQKLKTMKYTEQQPISEILLATSKLYSIQINVYHGMKFPIIFLDDRIDCKTIISLQCISMIHYNPLDDRRKKSEIVENKFMNTICKSKDESVINLNVELELTELNEAELITVPACNHSVYHTLVEVEGGGSAKHCSLLDTGAEVSLINYHTYSHLVQIDNAKFTMKSTTSKLIGMNNEKENILGYVELNINIFNETCDKLPFAIVKDGSIPCCILLGANFIRNNNLELDFYKDSVAFETKNESDKFQINTTFNHMTVFNEEGAVGYSGMIIADDNSCDDEEELVPKYLIAQEDLKAMQDRNFAIKQLKNKIRNNVPTRLWKCNPLKQFKHSAKSLTIKNELLVKGDEVNSPIVVNFPFLIEIVHKTHVKLNHIGRNKLVSMIQEHFWHPGLQKVCGDICRSCRHCQLFKTHRLDKELPVIKIQTRSPFEMVSIDCLSFTTSKKGNVAALVFIDHFSKWLCVHPIRDKKSSTVAKVLKQKILPALPKLPDSLLSDNGPEFIGSDFKLALDDYNIKHIFSSPHHPEGNGACERVNRTIIDRLKDMNDDRDWDENIYNVVINYNNTMHSKIALSPSQCILTKAYDDKVKLPLSKDELDCWKTGHPNFCSFRVGEKVSKMIHRTGNQLKYKLAKKYDGPFIVTKVQSNGLSYEVSKEGDQRIFKVSHKFLRKWHDVPSKYAKYILDSGLNEDYIIDENVGQTSNIGNWVSSSESESSSSSDDDINDEPCNLNLHNKDEINSGEYKKINSGEYRKINSGEYIKINSGEYKKINSGEYQKVNSGEYQKMNSGEYKNGVTDIGEYSNGRSEVQQGTVSNICNEVGKVSEVSTSKKSPTTIDEGAKRRIKSIDKEISYLKKNNKIIDLIGQTLTVSSEIIDRVNQIVSGESSSETDNDFRGFETLKQPFVKIVRAVSHSTPIHEGVPNAIIDVGENITDLSTLQYGGDIDIDDSCSSNILNKSAAKNNDNVCDTEGFDDILRIQRKNLLEVQELRENMSNLRSIINYSKSIIEQSKMSVSKSICWSRYNDVSASNRQNKTKGDPMLEEVSDIIGELPNIIERPGRVLRSHTAEARRKAAAAEEKNGDNK